MWINVNNEWSFFFIIVLLNSRQYNSVWLMLYFLFHFWIFFYNIVGRVVSCLFSWFLHLVFCEFVVFYVLLFFLREFLIICTWICYPCVIKNKEKCLLFERFSFVKAKFHNQKQKLAVISICVFLIPNLYLVVKKNMYYTPCKLKPSFFCESVNLLDQDNKTTKC